MRKCIFYVLSFVLLSTGLSIGFSDSASAWTDDSLPLCEAFEDFNTQIEADPRYDEEHTIFIAACADPAFYERGSGANRGQRLVYVIWDIRNYENRNSQQGRDGITLGHNGTQYTLTLAGYNSTNDSNPNALASAYFWSQPPGFPGSWNGFLYGSATTNGLFTIDNLVGIEQVKGIAYSESYINAGGDLYLDRGSTPPDPVAHKPNITWSVNDKNVIVYSDDAKNTAALDDYQIYWFISNTNFDTVQPSEPFALSGCTPPDYYNNFTVPIHFDYGVQAYYADQDCNILQVDDEGNRLTDNMVRLTIDGSTFDGSTTDHEAIIGEIEENAILKAIRKFRPNDGGLAGLIYAPIEAVATLPTIVGSCSPITLPLLGENISLQCIRPTIQASPMGPVYATISIIITGIVTWWVAWRTFSTIKNIQDPQDDRVEVLKL